MRLAKLVSGAPILTLAALLGPPRAASAQSGSPADSTGSRGRPAWVTSAAAATGAGLFLAFVHSGHGDQQSGSTHPAAGNGNGAPLTPVPPTTPAPVPSPAGGSTNGTPPTQTSGEPASAPGTKPPDSTPQSPPSTPGTHDPGVPPPPVVDAPPPVVNDQPPVVNDPPPVVNLPPPVVNDPPPTTTTDAPSLPQDDPIFVPGPDEQPQTQGFDVNEGMSTVPEPGSLVLTATGIIGLFPLVRRRKK